MGSLSCAPSLGMFPRISLPGFPQPCPSLAPAVPWFCLWMLHGDLRQTCSLASIPVPFLVKKRNRFQHQPPSARLWQESGVDCFSPLAFSPCTTQDSMEWKRASICHNPLIRGFGVSLCLPLNQSPEAQSEPKRGDEL